MNTNFLMRVSAIFLGIIGLIATFLTQEILILLEQTPTPALALIIQLMGALYLGVAVLNWMAKAVLIGGIYAKPLSLGNFCHFLIAAITLTKYAIHVNTPIFWVSSILFGIFAISFGLISFTHPLKNS